MWLQNVRSLARSKGKTAPGLPELSHKPEAERLELVGELLLVIPRQCRVGNSDEGGAEPLGVEDGAGAYGRVSRARR